MEVPRKLRIPYPGAIYHVMNRSDQREDIFNDTLTKTASLRCLAIILNRNLNHTIPLTRPCREP